MSKGKDARLLAFFRKAIQALGRYFPINTLNFPAGEEHSAAFHACCYQDPARIRWVGRYSQHDSSGAESFANFEGRTRNEDIER